MKLAKLSLAAMVVAGLASSSFAADTLADAFKNGKVNGQLKAWYFDKTDETSTLTPKPNNENITDFGVELKYVTDSFYGFYAGLTFQAAAQPWAEKNADALFVDEQSAGGSVLSEAYLGYKLGKTDVKIGRQYITTPLVGGSTGRIFTESFEGATIVNTDLPQTTLIGGYVSKFQGRTSNVSYDNPGDAPSFNKVGVFYGAQKTGLVKSNKLPFDGAYTLGVINKSITNTTLTAQYALVQDVAGTVIGDADVYFAEAGYLLPLNGFKLGFDAVYRASNTDKDVGHDGNYVAGRLSLKELAGFGASFAYGTTSSNDAVIVGLGNGPQTYTGTLIRASADTAAANTDSYVFTATYDLSKLGVTGLGILGQYSVIKQDKLSGNAAFTRANDIKYTSYAGAVTYDVPALKGLSLALQYETREKDETTKAALDTDEFRFLANYKF